MSAVVEWDYQDLRLVELVEELMLRQQEIAGLEQRKMYIYHSYYNYYSVYHEIPAREGAAVTSLLCHFFFKPSNTGDMNVKQSP